MTNHARFVADLTIPDDTEMGQGSAFVKAWRVENSGDEPWGSGYHLVFTRGVPLCDRLGQPLPPAQPGQQVDLTLELTAPDTPGTYFADWRLQDAHGRFFGDVVFLRIIVLEREPPSIPEPGPGLASDSQYLADITIPDGSRLAAGEGFVKSWRVRNSGAARWGEEFWITHIGGERLTEQGRQPLPPAPSGAEVTVSVQLQAPAENGRYISRWRMEDAGGRRFGQTLFLDINVVPQVATPWAFAPEKWRDTIWAITSIFESGSAAGDPAALQTSDAGIVSYGKHQATLQSGTLQAVLEEYLASSDSPVSVALHQDYFARVVQGDPALRNDGRFKHLLQTAAAEATMVKAQDEVFATRFYQPAVAKAQQLNLSSPLALACLYDTHIQGGLLALLPQVQARLGGIVGEISANGTITEPAWIATFLDLRAGRLELLADQAAARGDHSSAAALRTSIFRVETLQDLLQQPNLALTGDLSIRGRLLPGISFD